MTHNRTNFLMRLVIPALFVLLLVTAMLVASGADAQSDTPAPSSVAIAGTVQSVLGCSGDWQTDCEATFLEYSAANDLWMATWDLPAGSYEYKAALNGTWDENYGAGAELGGANIVLELAEDTSVTFFYDHNTHWVSDNVTSILASVPGSYQAAIGCPGDWQPECLRSLLQDPDGDGVYEFSTFLIPPGDYEAKVAYNQGWDLNYGLDGVPGGDNIPFSVPAVGHDVTFAYNTADNVMAITVSEEPVATQEEIDAMMAVPAEAGAEPEAPALSTSPQPEIVAIAGTIQSVLGCSGDWQTDCEATYLEFSAPSDLWMATWDLPAGSYEYKAALNGTWDENYGAGAVSGGDNISLELAEDTSVTFFYDNKTHWVSDNVNSILANVPGSYQSTVGCPGDWAPDCLRTLLQDPDGDGVYVYSTFLIPPGDYEAKVAYNLSWDLNYGLDGVSGGANIPFSVPGAGHDVTFSYDTADNVMTITVSDEPVVAQEDIDAIMAGAVLGDLSTAKAYWVAADTIAWKVEPEVAIYKLHYSPDAALAIEDGVVVGGEDISLRLDRDGLSDEILAKFPQLAGYTAFHIKEEDLPLVPEILKGQFAVSVKGTGGKIKDATALQIPGVLDDLYTYDGALGIIWDGGVPTLKVWAPTAKTVRLHLFASPKPDAEATVLDMELDPEFGVWSITGEADWNYAYYLYEVTVFAPSTGHIETNLVTDPYSLSLSMNSTRSQIVDLLNDPALMPDGWQNLEKPALDAPEDIVLYELHVRDFSIHDETVSPNFRGTFMAFTEPETAGMQHLQNLADAGLTHVHLLPVFDIATINEDKLARSEPDWDTLAAAAPDSEAQQAAVTAVENEDGFNWGYDPYHYTVPEGSYSTNPNGTTRIIQFRRMVMGLNGAGLRVVMDVVYNHTNASGQADRSVLDKIVPGYYHRLNATGAVETSTCCQNTATEHAMMQKLMVDSLVMWSKAYKVDGYRFDLMGHHMVENMVEAQDALHALTLENDGVDGPAIYLYGEGWNFGEVANGALGVNATQLNLPGTGIGTFNDRIRDAVRGGSPFGGRQEQGFVTGLYVDPNGITPGDEETQRMQLLYFGDQVRIALAGNLADYTFEGHTGETITGMDLAYKPDNADPTGYTQDPQEHIVYISAHDNETWFDKIQYSAPETATVEDRVRMQNMGISIVTLSQGVPFYHAGIDMLRSKSMDRDSYNSGDWFNVLDFTYQDNGWGHGLPVEGKNGADWGIMQPLLANPDIAPDQDAILMSVAHTQEMLRIRKSSILFRLRTAEDVMARVAFHNTGADQVPGLIVMSIDDSGDLEDLDPDHAMVVVLFNVAPDEVSFTVEDFAGMGFTLHPVLAESADPVVRNSAFDAESGTFTVPGRTTAVFVLAQ